MAMLRINITRPLFTGLVVASLFLFVRFADWYWICPSWRLILVHFLVVLSDKKFFEPLWFRVQCCIVSKLSDEARLRLQMISLQWMSVASIDMFLFSLKSAFSLKNYSAMCKALIRWRNFTGEKNNNVVILPFHF